jgi:hypothetical protein
VGREYFLFFFGVIMDRVTGEVVVADVVVADERTRCERV